LKIGSHVMSVGTRREHWLDRERQIIVNAEVEIARVEIAAAGQLLVRPSAGDFEQVYRAAIGVSWDSDSRNLRCQKPTERTYGWWFSRIQAAVLDEYRVDLRLTARTAWINVSEELRREITGDVRFRE
jgi:Integron Cassette Protein Hfx_Cass5